ISHITGTSGLWNELLSPPILVSKPNVVIGYNPIYEYASWPDVERIVTAIRRSISSRHERAAVGPGVDRTRSPQEPEFAQPESSAFAKASADRRSPATLDTTQHNHQTRSVH